MSNNKHLVWIALLATMLATFFAARKMSRIYQAADAQIASCTEAAQKKALRAGAKRDARKALGWGMAVAIGLLAVCKYTGFVLENLNLALGLFRLPQVPVASSRKDSSLLIQAPVSGSRIWRTQS